MKLNTFGIVKDGAFRRQRKGPGLFGMEMPANATDCQRLPKEQNRRQLVVIATNINLLATGVCFDSCRHGYLLKPDQQWQGNASACQVRVLNTIYSR
jgi:hypothetical protein